MNRLPLHALDIGDVGRLLEGVLQIAADAVVIVDSSMHIALYNGAAEQIFGHPVADMIGKPLDLLIPAESRERHRGQMARFAAGPVAARQTSERSHVRGLRADGTTFEAEASIAHLELDGDTYFAAFVRDVSDARHAARELAQSEARYRELAAAVPVGIFQLDAEGRCSYVNPRWSSITGIDALDALGRPWLDCVHADDLPGVRAAWHDAATRGQAMVQRFRCRRSDAVEVWVSCTCVPRRAADGQAAGHIGTFADITERQRQAGQLEQARAESELAARAKAQFLANVSHEIRTPLNGMIGMSSLLMDTGLTPEQGEILRTILQSSESLLGVLNDILDFSKVDAGKLEIDPQAFELVACVEESLDLVAAKAQEKGLNLAYWIDEDVPQVLIGDAARVRQILVNLLSNAVKFTHEGEVVLSVGAAPLPDLRPDPEIGAGSGQHRVRLRLKVDDTGIGIAAEHLPRLFHSFSQVDASTTRKYGGTGLGLAISKRLAELMEGSVSVRSEPGRGSTFVATVVLGLAPVHETRIWERPGHPGLVGRRLLVIDANLTNRRIVGRWARHWGMVATASPSIVEALDGVQRGDRFDAAVVDASAQDRDPMALIDALRREPALAALPVLVLTTLHDRAHARPLPVQAAMRWLVKPIKTRELHAGLLAVCSATGAALAPLAGAPESSMAGPATQAPRRLRVLVADDNALNRHVATSLARRLGHECDTVANGLEATDAVEQQAYDVILMDIQMPELDGLEAARWITRRRGDALTPHIVAMTANVGPGDRERFHAAGIRALLPKPVTLETMAAALQLALAAPAQRAGDGAAQTVAAMTAIDPQRLVQLREMQGEAQPQLVRDLMQMFLDDAPARVASLEEALAQGDADELAARAHRFLSSTQNIGALRMSALCMTIERHARAGRLGEAQPLLVHLGREFVAARFALDEALQRMEV